MNQNVQVHRQSSCHTGIQNKRCYHRRSRSSRI